MAALLKEIDMRLRFALLLVCFLVLTLTPALYAQEVSGELAATLEVLSPRVEVLRVNTVNWITVNLEAIVGVGDTIRTDATGRARITFFADGTDTELLPNTEYRITEFQGSGESFDLTVDLVLGQTTQRLSRLLDANSTYEVNTPGMALAARGTEFTTRVLPTGRSAMLVSEGNVAAASGEAAAEVPASFGIRADEELSDVVQARTFEELDAALDGCVASVQTLDDVRLNVRTGPGLDFPAVGTIAPSDINRFTGVIESGDWYRIEFRGAYGWILSSSAEVDEACAGLRVFADDYGPEDATLYTSLGDEISLEDLTTAPLAPQAESTETPDA